MRQFEPSSDYSGLVKLKRALSAIGGFVSKRKTALVAIGGVLAIIFLTAATQINIVTIVDGDNVSDITAFSADTDELLEQAGVKYGSKDEIIIENLGMMRSRIVVKRAFEVTVKNGTAVKNVGVSKDSTVADAVEFAGIKLGAEDTVNLPLDTVVTADMVIEVTAVTYQNEVKTQAIQPGAETRPSAELFIGETKKLPGVPGVKEVTYITKMIGGQVVETKATAETITRAAVKEITLVGTRDKAAEEAAAQAAAEAAQPQPDPNVPVDTPYAGVEFPGSHGGSAATWYSQIDKVSEFQPEYDFELDEYYRPVNYSKKVVGRATAYYEDGPTATGFKCQTGFVAVNPKQFPYGTRLYIVASDGSVLYGYASAEDTGAFVNWGTTIDLFFNSNAEVYNFGVREVEIYVLD